MEPKTLGRPTKPDDEKLVQKSIRLKKKHWDKVDRFGLEWLRSLIDKAKAPK